MRSFFQPGARIATGVPIGTVLLGGIRLVPVGTNIVLCKTSPLNVAKCTFGATKDGNEVRLGNAFPSPFMHPPKTIPIPIPVPTKIEGG